MTNHSVPPAQDARPVDASLFTFHGFNDRVAGARRRLGQARIRGGEPTVAVIEDPIFIPDVDRRHLRGSAAQPAPPDEPVPDNDPSIGIPGIVRARDPGVANVTGSSVMTLDEDVVYLGRLFSSYGHFLLESLAQTWFLERVAPSIRVAFHLPPGARGRARAWAPPILEAFGIPRDRIVALEQPTRFRRAIIPEPLFSAKQPAHERAAEPYQAVATRIAGGMTPSPQPVYLSRRLLASPERLTVGEAELEDMLRENGFLVAHPETMTFADQVRLFNAHTDFFACAGSAVHNVLFSLHRPRLHILTSGGPISPNFFLCSALVGSPTAFVNCLDTGERSPGRGPITVRRRLPEVIMTPTLVEYLDERGLMKTKLRARLGGRNPVLRRIYDEAWFYARIRAAWNDGTVPRAVISEAMAIAQDSWPVSLALARYYARRDPGRLDAMAEQFATLVAGEFDANRLARYRTDVEESLWAIRIHTRPETAKRLAEVAASSFLLDLRGKNPRRQGARRNQNQTRPASRRRPQPTGDSDPAPPSAG